MSRGLGYLTGLNNKEIARMRNLMRSWEADTGLPFFNMEKIRESLTSLVDEGYRGAQELYGRIDLRTHLSVDPRPGRETFTCLLLNGHVGWFHTHDNISRYYSKVHNATDSVVFTFDLTDLLMVYWGMSEKSRVYERMQEEFPYAESQVQDVERYRYNRNRTFLMNYSQIEQDLLSDDDMAILFALMDISEDNFYDTMNLIESKSYFFASLKFINKHLADRGMKMSQTMLSNRINRLATLGFITKIGQRKGNEKHYKESLKRLKSDKEVKIPKFNVISYFQIETFTARLRTAEKHDKKLKKKGIRLDQITEAEVMYCFGSTWAKRVFPVKTKKKPHKYAKEKKAYIETFFVLLKKQGYVTKEQLSGLAHKKLADRMWTMLVNRASGMKKRISKQLSEFLDIEDTGAIMLSYSLFHSLFTVIEKACKKGELYEAINNEEEKTRIIAYINQPIIRWLWRGREPDRQDAVC